jgi:hypothetical protein
MNQPSETSPIAALGILPAWSTVIRVKFLVNLQLGPVAGRVGAWQVFG